MVTDKTSSDKPQLGYPSDRPPYFANRFVRLLTKTAAAQELGPDACWLLTIIVHLEDTKRYTAPVTFYNEQLMPLLGIGGKTRLVSARSRAVESGWLVYLPGGKHKPGRYWVLVPERYADLPDTATDESAENVCRPKTGRHPGRQEENAVPKQDDNRTASGTEPGRQPGLFLSYTLDPNPDPKERDAANAAAPAGLLAFVDCWNENCPEGKRTRRDPPTAAVAAGWKRTSKNPELRQAFNDLERLGAAIRKATWAREQPWFTPESLFAKDSNRLQWKIEKLLNGEYDGDNGHANSKRAPLQTRGLRYDPAAPIADHL